MEEVAETGLPWLRLVASVVVDQPQAIFFFMSRKRVTDRAQRKISEGAS